MEKGDYRVSRNSMPTIFPPNRSINTMLLKLHTKKWSIKNTTRTFILIAGMKQLSELFRFYLVNCPFQSTINKRTKYNRIPAQLIAPAIWEHFKEAVWGQHTNQVNTLVKKIRFKLGFRKWSALDHLNSEKFLLFFSRIWWIIFKWYIMENIKDTESIRMSKAIVLI